MTYTTVDLTPRIGTQVIADRASLLDGSLAQVLRARGAAEPREAVAPGD